MRQVEVSRTIVFDDPRRARGFFEALVSDNIGIGRPEEIRAVFVSGPTGEPDRHPSQTRVFSPGTEVKMDFRYKHSRVKQYLKEGRALRIETVINEPSDIGVLRPARAPARAGGQGPRGQRSSAYDRACRPGLCHRLCALRAHPPALQGRANEPERSASGTYAPWPWPAPCAWSFTPSPASPTRAFAGSSPDSSAGLQHPPDELRPTPPPTPRPHQTPTRTPTPTPSPPKASAWPSSTPSSTPASSDPLLEADQPPAPVEIRRALTTIERLLSDYITNARLRTAA